MYNIQFLSDCFDVKVVEYAGVDGAICKATLIAKRVGIIEKEKLGLEIHIVPQHKAGVLNEIKRIGYLKDRECPLEVRVGDTLIVYISKSSA